MIGSLGDVIFEASSYKVKTFDGLKRSGSARIATHDVMSRKPVSEFIGPGLEQLSFTMRFDVMLGLDPKTELETLRELRDTGEAVPFVLNGEPVTENLWLIEQMEEDLPIIDNRGRIIVASVNVTLKEYVPPEVS